MEEDAPPSGWVNRRRRTSVAPTMSSDGATPPRPTRHSLVDSAIYVDGDRTSSPDGLVETYRQLHERLAAMAWIGLYRPDQQELLSRAHECGLHELAVENTILAHQRPELERCDAILFVVLRSGQPGTRSHSR